MLFIQYYKSLIGDLKITASETALLKIEHVTELGENTGNSITKKTQMQLEDYFLGKRKSFDIPLDLQGTDFQKQVWQALIQIPYGKTCSYKELAQAIENPKAIRAVGGANNKNPVSIIVPCHRVIGANRKLVGYAGGLDRKEALLALEQKYR